MQARKSRERRLSNGIKIDYVILQGRYWTLVRTCWPYLVTHRMFANAHLFINYLMDPQVIANNTNFIGFANANSTPQRCSMRRLPRMRRSIRQLRSGGDCSCKRRTLPSKRAPLPAYGRNSKPRNSKRQLQQLHGRCRPTQTRRPPIVASRPEAASGDRQLGGGGGCASDVTVTSAETHAQWLPVALLGMLMVAEIADPDPVRTAHYSKVPNRHLPSSDRR